MDRMGKFGFASKFTAELRELGHKIKGKKHSRDKDNKDKEDSQSSKTTKRYGHRASHSSSQASTPPEAEGRSVDERTVFEEVDAADQPARCKKPKGRLKWKSPSDGSEPEKRSADKASTPPSPTDDKIQKRSDSSSEGLSDYGPKVNESKKIEEREKEQGAGRSEPPEEAKIGEDRSKPLNKDKCKNVVEDKCTDKKNVDKEKGKYVGDDKYKGAEKDRYKYENDNEEKEKDKNKKEDEEKNEKNNEKEENEKEDKNPVKEEEKDDEKNGYNENEKEKDNGREKGEKKAKDKEQENLEGKEKDREHLNLKVPNAKPFSAPQSRPSALQPRYTRSEYAGKHTTIFKNSIYVLQDAKPIEKSQKEPEPASNLGPTPDVQPIKQDDGSTKANAACDENEAKINEKATENGASGGGIMRVSNCVDSNVKGPCAQMLSAPQFPQPKPIALRPRYKPSECVIKHSAIFEKYKHLLQDARPIEKPKKESVPTFRLKPTSEFEPRKKDDGSAKTNAAGEEKGAKATENGASGGGIIYSSNCVDANLKGPSALMLSAPQSKPLAFRPQHKPIEYVGKYSAIFNKYKHQLQDARPIEKPKKESVPTCKMEPAPGIESKGALLVCHVESKSEPLPQANPVAQSVPEQNVLLCPKVQGEVTPEAQPQPKREIKGQLVGPKAQPQAHFQPKFDFKGLLKCKPQPQTKAQPKFDFKRQLESKLQAETPPQQKLDPKGQLKTKAQPQAQPRPKFDFKAYLQSKLQPQAQLQPKFNFKGQSVTKAQPHAQSQPKFDFKGHLESKPQPPFHSQPKFDFRGLSEPKPQPPSQSQPKFDFKRLLEAKSQPQSQSEPKS